MAIAAWPLPNPELANRATLWPVPTVYSVIPTGHAFGDPLPRVSEAHVQVARWRATIRRSAWSRVLEESRTRQPAAPIDLVLPEEVEAVVYLGDAAPGGYLLYETLMRLGYLLRRTVTHVPEEL